MQERKQILEMLAENQITVDDADRLFEKLGEGNQRSEVVSLNRAPKMLRIHVLDKTDKVNIQLPLALLRTGIKLKAMLPDSANNDLKARGVDLAQLSEMDVDELIAALADFRVEVDSEGEDKVLIYCE
jgi:hypothetical protein